MSETKTKKILFGLFLIPLASLVLVLFLAPHYESSTANAAAAVCGTTTSKYTITDDGKTITRKITGTKVVNPGTSYQTCSDVNETDTFTEKGGTLVYNGPNKGSTDNPCYDQVTLDTAPISGSNDSGSFQGHDVSAGCNPNMNTDTFQILVPTTYTGTAGSSTDDGPTKTTNCSIEGLGWILCPVLKLGAGAADAALGFISTNFLEVNIGLYSTTSTDSSGATTPSATYSAWQWILGFANIIFVIVFLVIIFAQATGFGISNYGIKKMLPKLIVGVVLINVSFFICQILIDASNLTGYGINKFFDGIAQGIPTAKGGDALSSGTPFSDIAVTVLTSIASVAIVIAAWTVFGPILAAAVVALIMIFLFLVARQALIILAIIIAPLAFASWLLPNTEKFFKQWWKVFTQLLLLFPIIALVFGASKLVSRIIVGVYSASGTTDSISSGLTSANSVSGGSSNFLGQVIAAAVLVVPLFAVPFLLKGAMNSVPVLGDFAKKHYNNRTSGAKSAAKNSRYNKYEEQRKAKRNAQIAAGTYDKNTPYRAVSAFNQRRNKNKAFNFVTRGYGATVAQSQRGEARKQGAETMESFSEDDVAMSALLQTGGRYTAESLRAMTTVNKKTGATERKLNEGQVQQLMQLQQAKLSQTPSAHFAATEYLAGSDKGSFDDIIAGLRSAKENGATDVEMSQYTAQIQAKIRGSGDGYRLAQFQQHLEANKDPKTGIADVTGTKTATQADIAAASGSAWDKVDPKDFSRFSFKGKDAAEEAEKKKAFETWLTSKSGNTQKMLEKYSDMGGRSQTEIERPLLDAAEHFRKVRLAQATAAAAAPGGPKVPDELLLPVADDMDHAKKIFAIR